MALQLKIRGARRAVALVVFDCDGVLLDTMPLKIEAFRRWVPERYANLEPAFMSYIMGSFGHSRTYHVDYFYRELVGRPLGEAERAAEVARFTQICEPLCAEASWRTGSREFVESCRKAGAGCRVLSGTPQQALEAMLKASGGLALFDGIVGSPPGKPESLKRILGQCGVPAERAVFIGDANADQEAALANGVPFVYLPSEADRPAAAAVETEVSDLRELLP